jgi:hypothetical protein
MRIAGTTRVPTGSQHDGAKTFDHLHTEASSSPARAAGRRRFPKRALGLLAAGAIVMVAAGCGTLGRASFSESAFLSCTRAHESDTAGGYGAVNPSGTYRGAYQFSQSTWNSTARHAGRPDLVGVDPAQAAPWDQDALALDLYRWQGKSPWGGRC